MEDTLQAALPAAIRAVAEGKSHDEVLQAAKDALGGRPAIENATVAGNNRTSARASSPSLAASAANASAPVANAALAAANNTNAALAAANNTNASAPVANASAPVANAAAPVANASAPSDANRFNQLSVNGFSQFGNHTSLKALKQQLANTKRARPINLSTESPTQKQIVESRISNLESKIRSRAGGTRKAKAKKARRTRR